MKFFIFFVLLFILRFFFVGVDPILLSKKQSEWAFSNGEGGDEISRAGSLLAGGYTVQRKRRHQARQRLNSRRRSLRACVSPRPHRRASRVGPLPPGRLRRAAERAGGSPPARPGQRARARVRPTRRCWRVVITLPLLAADVARVELGVPRGLSRVSAAE